MVNALSECWYTSAQSVMKQNMNADMLLSVSCGSFQTNTVASPLVQLNASLHRSAVELCISNTGWDHRQLHKQPDRMSAGPAGASSDAAATAAEAAALLAKW
jgi:hypothetical protein